MQTSKIWRREFRIERKMLAKASIKVMFVTMTPPLRKNRKRVTLKKSQIASKEEISTWDSKKASHRWLKRIWHAKTYGFWWKDHWLRTKIWVRYQTWSMQKVSGIFTTSSKRWKCQSSVIVKQSNFRPTHSSMLLSRSICRVTLHWLKIWSSLESALIHT